MKLLVIGANSTYAIERFYLNYWRENKRGIEVDFLATQNLFYEYYNKNSFNKILFKLGVSKIYCNINREVIKRIDLFAPDIIFIFKGMEVYPETLKYAKIRGIKLINYNPDNPFIFSGRGSGNINITKSIGLYDYHFTYSKEIKKQIELKFNIPTQLLPFAYDISDEEFEFCKKQPEKNKVCFIGNPDFYRAKLIYNLAKKELKSMYLVIVGINF